MAKEQEGIVIELAGDMARVKTSRHNDCENCGACPGNAAIVVEASNAVGARPGQRVALQVPEVNMLKAAFIVYVLPLLALFMGAAIGHYLAGGLGLPALWLQIGGGGLAFGASLAYIRYVDRRAKSNAKMQPIITRILSN